MRFPFCRIACATLLAGSVPGIAMSQPAATAGSRLSFEPPLQAPPALQDNSFLLEEAYNQERGVVQHIFVAEFARGSRAVGIEFEQEWPAPTMAHQLSYSLPFSRSELSGNGFALGDVELAYRYQLLGQETPRVALAPKFGLSIPTGDWKKGQGAGAPGFELRLPLSLVVGERVFAHTNIAGAVIPRARNTDGLRGTVTSYLAGQSLIFAAHPNLNLMLETLWTRTTEVIGADATVPVRSFVISPGLRGALNFRSGLQIVPGIAFPIGVGPSQGERSVLLYLSLEHPFRSTD